MVLKKDFVLTLLKSIDGTINAAGFSLSSPKNPGEDGSDLDSDLVFCGEIGEVTLTEEDNILNVKCKTNDTEYQTVSQILIEYEKEEWNAKDTKSVANEVAECISQFFGTPLIYDTAESKGKSDKSPKNKNEETQDSLVSKKKSINKDSVVTYEPVNLANRIENIYSDLKGKIDENIEKYEMFLPEEYFNEYANKYIIETIRNEDRQTMKKIFNAFNTFYDDGSNDVQSLIAVSILGVNFAKEEELLNKSESYIDDDLYDVVKTIVVYLNSSSGKRKLNKLENPVPYKSRRIRKK